MVQENPKLAGCRLAFCAVCGAAYLLWTERPHSPCHATDPILTYDLEAMFDALDILAAHLNGSVGKAAPVGSEESPASPVVPPGESEADEKFPSSVPAPEAPEPLVNEAGRDEPETAAGELPPVSPPPRRRPSRAKKPALAAPTP